MTSTSRPSRLRAVSPWLVVAAAFVAIGILAAPGGGGSALDPNGTSPQGAKALVLLLRQAGARVDLSADVPTAGSATALLLTDQLDDARRTAVADWVRQGGHLVVADPASALQVGVAQRPGNGITTNDLHPVGPCAITSLRTIRTLDVGPSYLLRPPARASTTSCFGIGSRDRDVSFLVAADVGRGSVVGLGGAGVWTNERLGRQDNAGLAVDLLASTPAPIVSILIPSRAGSGQRSGLQLTSPRFREALVQLLVAFGFLAWWRGRRLGRPVDEALPAEVPASEIVRAAGELMARTASRDAAAAEMREAARRTMAPILGLAPSAGADVIADAAVGRLGLEHGRILDLLADQPVHDDAALVGLADALAHLRQEARHARTP